MGQTDHTICGGFYKALKPVCIHLGSIGIEPCGNYEAFFWILIHEVFNAPKIPVIHSLPLL